MEHLVIEHAAAIRSYQSSVGINQSGAIDNETVNRMKSDASSDGPCESSSTVENFRWSNN